MLSPQVVAQAGGNVGVKEVHNRYAELRFKPPGKPIQSRLLAAREIVLGEQIDDSADDWFITAARAMPVRSDFMVKLLGWDAPIESLRALVDSGKTIQSRSRPYYVGETSNEPAYVEVRAVYILELNDGTAKVVRSVVPRCKLWSAYQTWHNLDREGMVLVHDLVLRIVKTTERLDGAPLDKVPDEGIFWYSDLTDWTPPKARIYEIKQLRDAQADDTLSEDVLDEDDDSRGAIGGSAIEPAGRGY